MSFNKSLCAVLGVLAVSSVMAYEQSFEGNDIVAGHALSLSGWGGYGTYSNTLDQLSLPAGTPIVGTHDKHLSVDGWVTNTLEGTAGDAQLDMLVKVARPDEELSGMSDNEAKFAMAIDLDGTLKYWTGTAWSALGATTYAEGQWIRVAVIYDNGSQLCKVSVDGNACNTASGYTTTNKTATGGAWYPLITTATKISSLKVVGTTALDDVKVAYNSNSSYVPEYKDASGNDIVVAQTGGVNVPMSWFDQNSIATNVTTTTDGSGMTIAEKYITGLDPNNGSKFEMTDMTMTRSGEMVQAVVAVPNTTPAPGYAIKVQTKNGGGSWSEGTAPSDGKATINLSGDSNVSYFRMVVEPTASNP